MCVHRDKHKEKLQEEKEKVEEGKKKRNVYKPNGNCDYP